VQRLPPLACRPPLAALFTARSSHGFQTADSCSPVRFSVAQTQKQSCIGMPEPGSSMLGVHLPEPRLRQPGVQRRMPIPLAEALLQDGRPAQVDALPDALPRASVRLFWRLNCFHNNAGHGDVPRYRYWDNLRALTASAPCCISLQLCRPMMGSSCSICLLSNTPTLSAWALPFIFVLCCAVGINLAPDLELPHSAFQQHGIAQPAGCTCISSFSNASVPLSASHT